VLSRVLVMALKGAGGEKVRRRRAGGLKARLDAKEFAWPLRTSTHPAPRDAQLCGRQLAACALISCQAAARARTCDFGGKFSRR
jgi:hypothetical protein